MATMERNMQQLKRLCHFARKLDRLGRIADCRYMATRVQQRKFDPLALFMMKDVQTILRQLSGSDLDKTYRADAIADYKENPIYLVLNEEEMEREMQRDRARAAQLLQMPPFMEARKPRDSLISDDPDIAPAVRHKMVFADVSMNQKRIKGYNDRPVVVRHPDGKLTHADWNTYDRVSQIFNPKPDRKMYMPKMFEEEQLEEILGKAKYVYILDRACVQFEPDSEDFIRVTRRVYEHISKFKKYDDVRSTRFFGHMAFYFCWTDKIEGLLLDMIQRELLNDAAALINLRQLIKLKKVFTGDSMTIVQKYVKEEAMQSNKNKLLTALKNYKHSMEQKEWHAIDS